MINNLILGANMQIGSKAENKKTINQNEQEIFLQDYVKDYDYMVLYFYPKDNTPGCTTQANSFNDSLEKFQELNTIVIGVSPDDAKKHCKFIEKYNLDFDLICDTNLELCNAFKVWQLKKFMGREYMGVVRSTFILDKDLNVLSKFESVKVKNHIQEVLEEINNLKGKNNG